MFCSGGEDLVEMTPCKAAVRPSKVSLEVILNISTASFHISPQGLLFADPSLRSGGVGKCCSEAVGQHTADADAFSSPRDPEGTLCYIKCPTL